MKNVRKSYLFLKKNVYPYRYCYVYDSDKHFTFSTNKKDFLHMCGLKYKFKQPHSDYLGHFIEDLLHNQINYKRLMVHSDNTTYLKLSIISILPKLFKSLNLIVSDHKQYQLSFSYDKQLSSRNKIIGLGLKNIYGRFYVPLTLLNLRIKPQMHGYKVHAILRMSRNKKHITVVNSDDYFKKSNNNYYHYFRN